MSGIQGEAQVAARKDWTGPAEGCERGLGHHVVDAALTRGREP